jgi:hypothetical protein
MIGLLVVLLLLLIFVGTATRTPGYVYDTGKPGMCVGVIASVHGNEPAGGLLLEQLIPTGWFTNIKTGSVRIIATPNPIGMQYGIRSRLTRGDLNRSFYAGTTDPDAIAIRKFFEPCDVVIDFHEGWGFHQLQPESLGSTVMANSPWSHEIAQTIVKDLNNSAVMKPLGYKKQFVVMPWQQACDIKTTFACDRARLNQHHILVETSGQNNVQPLHIRQQQIIILLQSLFKHTNLTSL